MKNITQEQFEQFLKDNNCFDKYISYCDINEIFSPDRPKKSISDAFFWFSTKEGHRFWMEINRKLQEFLTK